MKIPNLPAAAPLGGGELLPIVQAGLARRASMEQISDRLSQLLPASFRGLPGGASDVYANLADVANQSVPDGTTLIRVADTGMTLQLDAAVTPAYVAANPLTSVRDQNGKGFRQLLQPSDAIGYRAGTAKAALDELIDGSLSLKRFGASVGQGSASYDQGAFEDLFAYQLETRRYLTNDYGSYYPIELGFVPPGDYRVSGALGAGVGALGLWCIPGTATITIVDDNYLFDIPDYLDFTFLSGLRVRAGKGMLRHSYTGANVSNKHVVEHCIINDFTKCAIVSEAADMPYWWIHGNIFRAKHNASTVTKDIVLGGLMDNNIIENNSCENARIHLQLGPLNSGTKSVRNNSFLSVNPDETDYDVWVIPNDIVGAYGINSGPLSFEHNKWGNEVRTATSQNKPRLLTAAMSGATREDAVPDLTWQSGADGANWLGELKFIDNSFFAYTPSGDGIPASLIDNYLDKLTRLYWDAANKMEGGVLDHLVRHLDGGARVTSNANTNSFFDFGPGMIQFGYGSPFRKGVSNRPMGFVNDPLGMDSSRYKLLPSPDPGEVPLAYVPPTLNWGAEAGISTAAVADRLGNNNAINVTWDVAGRYIYTSLPDITLVVGLMGWIAIDHWYLDNPAARIRVLLQNSVTLATAFDQSYTPDAVKLPIIAPFYLPGGTNLSDWQLRVTAPVIGAGANKAVLGEVRVVAAQHAPTLGRRPPIAEPPAEATAADLRATIIELIAAARAGDLLHL